MDCNTCNTCNTNCGITHQHIDQAIHRPGWIQDHTDYIMMTQQSRYKGRQRIAANPEIFKPQAVAQ